MNANLMPAASNILMGIVFIAISYPLLKRKINRNDLYGFRTSKALESEENRYNINSYGAKQLTILSILVILIGIISLIIPMNEDMHLIVAIGPITLSVLIALIKTLIYEHKL